MSQIIENNSQITLTTGMFDLMKAQLAKKKLSTENEEKVKAELRSAKQVFRKDLPSDVVDVYKVVTVKDTDDNSETIYRFVPPRVAKNKNGTTSILTDMGLALLGHPVGKTVSWETATGTKTYQIVSVTDINAN